MFELLADLADQQVTDSEKLANVLQPYTREEYFTTEQVRRIVRAFREPDARVEVGTHTHKHTHTQTHTQTHTHLYVNSCTHIYTHVYIHRANRADCARFARARCSSRGRLVYTQTHTHSYINTHTHIYTHICIYSEQRGLMGVQSACART